MGIETTGTVDETEAGYAATVEGITFTLVGSEELDGAVGDEASIEGELMGTTITISNLIVD